MKPCQTGQSSYNKNDALSGYIGYFELNPRRCPERIFWFISHRNEQSVREHKVLSNPFPFLHPPPLAGISLPFCLSACFYTILRTV